MLKYLTAITLLSMVILPDQNNLPKKPLATDSPNKVVGLELPAEVFPKSENGFTKIQAKTEGQVKWLVLSDKTVQYLQDDENKSIILNNVSENNNLHIFAVAVVDGKLTEFASTKIAKGKSAINKQESTPDKLDYKIRWH